MKALTRLILPALLTAGQLAAAAAPESAAKPAEKSAEKAPAMPSYKDGTLEKPDAAWLAKVLPDYPLTTCVVSGDKLGGDMGEAINMVWKQKGQPDRLVRFCCGDCPKDFQKDPAKYLKLIDEAAAAKAKAAAAKK